MQSGDGHESKRTSKKSYSREFLVSLSDLEICTKLPPDFDASILSEFEDASNSNVEWQRFSGGQSLQSSRRGEYGTSPPNAFSRGGHGRWDARSSGSNDADGQSDRESDTGKRYGNQFHRSWQSSEHDGLLGSGAFPRPSGYGVGGPSAPRGRGSGPYQLNKSSEPYQPPRPYKAIPHGRRDNNTDSINDETFGSAECSNNERDEEERKRRASFELLRKEQQKSLQEKLKQNPEKHKDKVGVDVDVLLGDTEEEKAIWRNNTNSLNDSSAPLHHDELVKSLPHGGYGLRPLIPPGFACSTIDKNAESSLLAPEMDPVSVDDTAVSVKVPILSSNSTHTKEYESKVALFDDTLELHGSRKVTVEHSFAHETPVHEIPSAVSCSSSAFSSSQTPPASVKWDTGNIGHIASDAGNLTGVEATGQDTSILQKLFNGALTLNDNAPPIFTETVKTNDDPWHPISSETSKFAHWFLDEDKKASMGTSKPRDLLSLIVSGDNSGSKTSDPPCEVQSEVKPSEFFSQIGMIADKPGFVTAISGQENSLKPVFHSPERDSKHGVLTCEDLEQFILSEANEGSSYPQISIQDPSLDILDAKSVTSKADVDDHASLHLLSLLQKGSSKVTNSKAIDCFESFDVSSMRMGSAEEVPKPEKTLTLEALFGSAFMKELQSVGAPVSAKGSSVGGSARTDLSGPNHGFPLSFADSTTSNSGFHAANEESNFLHSEHGPIHPVWTGFSDSQTEGVKFNGGAFVPEDRADGMMDLQLPEEDSLICSNEVLNHETPNLLHMGDTLKTDEHLPRNGPVEVVGKVGGLSSLLKRDPSLLHHGLERGPPFQRNDSLDAEHMLQKLHGQRVPPHFPKHHLDQNQFGAIIPQAMEQNVRAEINRPGIDNVSHHALHHPFQSSMYRHHHPYHGLGMPPRFESPPGHLPPQQMPPIPSSFPSSHSIHGLPGSAFIPPAMNHFSGHVPPDIIPVQSFPSSQRPPDFGVPIPGTMAGNSGYPDSLERYEFDLQAKEMELRANAKQVYQVGGGHGKVPGAFGLPELEMGFRY